MQLDVECKDPTGRKSSLKSEWNWERGVNLDVYLYIILAIYILLPTYTSHNSTKELQAAMANHGYGSRPPPPPSAAPGLMAPPEASPS